MHLRHCLASLALLATLGAGHAAKAATRPYVTVTDDGTLAKDFTRTSTIAEVVAKTLAMYEAAGQKRPDILSVWTTFPMTGNEDVTLFLPAANDVTGVGFDGDIYPDDGTFTTEGTAPLRAVLLHNDIRSLPSRAAFSGTSDVDGLAEYLFLLELSHVWGPAMRVPARSGADEHAFIGFPFHWSFWMDAGGSVAGGNRWQDNGDGTFTTAKQGPGTLTYSMLDLYLMGLASRDEVPPFGLLTNAKVTTSSTDPMTKRGIQATTFPWFDDAPVTVEATRVSYTIDDVIASNGERSPASSASPKSFTLGIALVVGAKDTDADRAAGEAAMDRYAPKFAPAFERATGGRGKLDVISSVDVPESSDPAAPEAQAEAPASETAPPAASDGGSGCALVRHERRTASDASLLVAAMALAGWMSRRRRHAA